MMWNKWIGYVIEVNKGLYLDQTVKTGTLFILVCQESEDWYLSKNLKEPALQRLGISMFWSYLSTRSRTDTVLIGRGRNILITLTDFQIWLEASFD